MTPSDVPDPPADRDLGNPVEARVEGVALPRWMRWFAAEFLVVVSGVLVALALSSWYEAATDRTRERTYLHQLWNDLLETEELLAETDSLNRRSDYSALMLLRESLGQHRSPTDSVLAWIERAPRLRRARAVPGTARALVSSGELTLVHDDSLRGALTSYLDFMDDRLDNQETWLNEHQVAVNDLRRVDGYAAVFPLYSLSDSSDVSEDYRSALSVRVGVPFVAPDSVTVLAFLSRPSVAAAYARLSEMKMSLWLNRRGMLSATRDFRTLLEPHLR